MLLTAIFAINAQVQQAATATGGVAVDRGGSSSYSIGQVVYTTHAGSNDSVAQGVQHAHEIYTVNFVKSKLTIKLAAYPNPTNDYLTLTIGNSNLENLNYQIFEASGKLVKGKQITSTSETIKMKNLSSGIYYLRIAVKNKKVKTFKIIKNKF